MSSNFLVLLATSAVPLETPVHLSKLIKFANPAYIDRFIIIAKSGYRWFTFDRIGWLNLLRNSNGFLFPLVAHFRPEWVAQFDRNMQDYIIKSTYRLFKPFKLEYKILYRKKSNALNRLFFRQSLYGSIRLPLKYSLLFQN